MDDIASYSKSVKDIADEILIKTGLVNILSEFGEVFICGSYKYDLMWGPDIDIIVKCDDPKGLSRKALQKLIDSELFQKYEYGDFVNFKRKDRPNSYIMNLRLPYKGQEWEIETWFFKDIPEGQIELDSLITEKLNNQNRLAILEIKKKRDELELDKHQISSVTIYKKVLIDDISSIEKILSKDLV